MEREQLNFNGNQEHFNLMIEAVEKGKISIWNYSIYDRISNFKGADLKGIDLCEANLANAFLQQAELSNSNLRGSNLNGANLRGANLKKANLSAAQLTNADLREADLSGAFLSNALLNGANLQDALLEGAVMDGVRLNGADLTRANLSDSSIRDSDFTDSTLYRLRYDNWDISGALCKRAFWDGEQRELIEYRPGEFEELYNGFVLIIDYPQGINEHVYHSFPTLIKLLAEEMEKSCSLKLASVELTKGMEHIRVAVNRIKEGTDKIELRRELNRRYNNIFERIEKDIDERTENG